MEGIESRSCKKACFQYGKKRIPPLSWVPNYDCDKGKSDVIAGTTVGLMLVPQSLAYAVSARLGAVYGLYAAYIGTWIYVFLGTSKHVSVGPTAVMSSIIATTARGDIAYAVCLSAVAGFYMLILGFLELGWMMWFISHPTLSGFISAAALGIAAGQLGDLLGVPDWSSDFVGVCADIVTKLEQVRWTDTLLGLITLLLLFLMRMLQKVSRVKHTTELEEGGVSKMRHFWKSVWYLCLMRNILVVVLATLIDFYVYVDDKNPLYIVGTIPAGLQSPDIGVFYKFADEWRSLLLDGILVALVGLLEQLAIAQAFSKTHGYEIDNNQEMLTLGFCNIVGSLFQCYPVTGSFSRTSVNSESGGKTQLGGIVTGSVVVLSLLLLTPLFHYIPRAVLAAVIIFAVIFMVDFCHPLQMWRIRKLGTISWTVTFVAVLLLGIEYGILVGVVFDLLQVLARNLRSNTDIRDIGEGVVVIEVNRGCNFLGVKDLKEQLEKVLDWEQSELILSHSTSIRTIIFNMNMVSELDITALESLSSMQEMCEAETVVLYSVGLSEELSDDIEHFGVPLRNFATSAEAFSAATSEIADHSSEHLASSSGAS